MAAVPTASTSGFTSPLGPCFKGRSILKVMAVEVQYSSNPYKYLDDKIFLVKDVHVPSHLALLIANLAKAEA